MLAAKRMGHRPPILVLSPSPIFSHTIELEVRRFAFLQSRNNDKAIKKAQSKIKSQKNGKGRPGIYKQEP